MENNFVKKVFTGWFESPTEEPEPQADSAGGNSLPHREVYDSEGPIISPAPAPAPAPTSMFGASDKPDPEYVAVVMQEIENANLPGVDYFEFTKAVGQMVQNGNTLEFAIQNAFTALQAADATLSVQKLLSSAQHYISVVKSLFEKFVKSSKGDAQSKKQRFTDFSNNVKTLAETGLDPEAAKSVVDFLSPKLKELIQESAAFEDRKQNKMNLVVGGVVSNIESDIANIQRILGTSK